MNRIKQKILLLLGAGLTLGLTQSPIRQYKIIKAVGKEWQRIDKENFKKEVKNLYRSKLIKIRENSDGTLTYVLTEKGKLRVLTYKFQEMKIPESKWDGKWRMVTFDIPEKLKSGRNALREKLRNLGFRELQKSVFVFPRECKNEIDFIIEFFNLKKYVRYGVLDFIDNDLHLRDFFHLSLNY